MYKHILIATDGSAAAEKAVDQGLALANALGARATAVVVTEPWAAMVPGEMAISFPVDDYEKGVAAHARLILDGVVQRAADKGVACETLHVKDEYPAEGIINAAKELGCDLVVMSSHGRRGLARLLLGSQTHKVVSLSGVSVLVCR